MHRTATLVPGDLLIAPPEVRDTNFRRTVVLICEHTTEGSFGLILNRTLKARVCDLSLDLGSTAPLSLGGPVQTNTLHFLHSHGGLVQDTIQVTGRVHWGGELSAVRLLLEVEAATPRDLRFFLGYAGWSAGQLEDEIQSGGWFVLRGHDQLVFADEPDGLWRTALARMGGEYALLVNYPDDPRSN